MPYHYYDVDLCYHLIEKGYFNVVRNDVVLNYHKIKMNNGDREDEKEELYHRHPSFYKKDPFYNPNLTQIGADFSYNLDSEEVSRVKRMKNIRGFKRKEGRILYSMECREGSKGVRIYGWAYIQGKAFNDLRKVSVLLFDEGGGVILVETKKVYRSDVAASMGNVRKLNFIGFECFISMDNLENEGYQIGLGVSKHYVMTEEEIKAWTFI
jgi:hypothetical protein